MKNYTFLKVAAFLGLVATTAYAATVTVPNTFSDGDILTAAELNQNFSTLADTVNSLDDNNIATGAAISPAKISATIKSSGISRSSTTGALSVNVDDSSIEISGDEVQIKDDGVTTAKVADNAITRDKVAVIDQIPAGSVMQFHTFDGTVDIPRGWMILNGDVVNQTNYDAIHGAGAYAADGVASSALLSKNLPDMDSRYATGSDTTGQDGSSAITAVGNASNQVNLSHTHSDGSYHARIAEATSNQLGWQETSVVSYFTNRVTSLPAFTFGAGTITLTSAVDVGGDSSSALSSTQSIRPDSIEFIFIMKVI